LHQIAPGLLRAGSTTKRHQRQVIAQRRSTRFQLDSDQFKDRREPRNSRRGDSESTVDLRVSKIVQVGALRITGFWEMFNAFNADNFINYAGSLQSSSFAQPPCLH
jgi:hypothetical protein